MRLASVNIDGHEEVCALFPSGLAPLGHINQRFGLDWPTDMWFLIQSGRIEELNVWFRSEKSTLHEAKDLLVGRDRALFLPLYRHPRKIWGIGLNYKAHAQDLSEKAPEDEPASFMKPDTTIIGYMDPIRIPLQSQRTTAEAELGVVIGRVCKDVARENWMDVVAGFTTILDMTAEDILRRNPRFLTRAKSFDTFFSFGPVLVTPDEIHDVSSLRVSTVINGTVHATNTVANMTFPPDFLLSFHSKVMTMVPGDVISTGTPGAVPISEGDVVECRIDGFDPLVNPVRDLKATC